MQLDLRLDLTKFGTLRLDWRLDLANFFTLWLDLRLDLKKIGPCDLTWDLTWPNFSPCNMTWGLTWNCLILRLDLRVDLTKYLTQRLDLSLTWFEKRRWPWEKLNPYLRIWKTSVLLAVALILWSVLKERIFVFNKVYLITQTWTFQTLDSPYLHKACKSANIFGGRLSTWRPKIESPQPSLRDIWLPCDEVQIWPLQMLLENIIYLNKKYIGLVQIISSKRTQGFSLYSLLIRTPELFFLFCEVGFFNTKN